MWRDETLPSTVSHTGTRSRKFAYSTLDTHLEKLTAGVEEFGRRRLWNVKMRHGYRQTSRPATVLPLHRVTPQAVGATHPSRPMRASRGVDWRRMATGRQQV